MKKKTKVMWNVGLIGGLLLLLFVLEQLLPSGSDVYKRQDRYRGLRFH